MFLFHVKIPKPFKDDRIWGLGGQTLSVCHIRYNLPKSFRQVLGERLPDVFGRHLTKTSPFFVPCGLILWISILVRLKTITLFLHHLGFKISNVHYAICSMHVLVYYYAAKAIKLMTLRMRGHKYRVYFFTGPANQQEGARSDQDFFIFWIFSSRNSPLLTLLGPPNSKSVLWSLILCNIFSP